MKRPYIAPIVQSLEFSGLKLLTDFIVGGSTTDENPNQAKRHTIVIRPDAELLDEEEERFNETAQSFSLPRYSVWD